MPAKPRRSDTAGVVRLLDASGGSSKSWEAAVADALKSVRDEVPAPVGVEVSRMWAELSGRTIKRYRVAVKVAYRAGLKAPVRGKA